MKERPILFSAPMVRANAAGLKNQTRRTLKDQEYCADWTCATRTFDSDYLRSKLPGADENSWVLQERPGELDDRKWQPVGCPYGKPGDFLLVKEAAWMWCERRPNGVTPTGRDKWHYAPLESAPVQYAADHPQTPTTSIVSPNTGNQWGWRMKIGRFLPRYASRTTLEVTRVRLEKLWDISEQDAINEGVSSTIHLQGGRFANENFAILWEQINGEGSWDMNPWVWAVNYKIIKPEAA